MKKAFFLVTLTMLLLLPVAGWATTYTVGSSGCDYTSIQAAINGESLGDGDIVEIRADTAGGSRNYNERVVILSGDSGFTLKARDGDNITINVINEVDGWNISTNWTDNGGNVWYINQAHTPGRLLIDGTEALKAESVATIDSTYKWYYDYGTSLLYVYSVGNPAETYSSIEGSSQNYALYIEGTSSIHVENLNLRGGYYASVLLRNADDVIIKGCEIGEYAVKGVYISEDASTHDPSSNVTISDCTIDGLLRASYTHESIGAEDGITFYHGANNCDVTNCIFKGWGHSCIQMTSNSSSYSGVHDNIISNNYFSGEGVSYLRAIGMGGIDGKCQCNSFIHNIVVNMPVRSQINGNNNTVAYNFINGMTNTPCHTYGTAQAFELQGFGSYVCHHNKIINNTMVNCEEAGIRLVSDTNNKENNIIANNIIYNCGTNSKDGLDGYGIVVDNASDILNNTFQNNLVYNPGISNVIYYRGTAMTVSTWNTSDSNGDTIEEDIQSDPLLTSNYHLSANSPCINAGTTISGFHETALDIDKQPILGTPDIGCDERKALWWDGRRWHMQRMY